MEDDGQIWLLGQSYDSADEDARAAFSLAFSQLIWVTYRRDMAPIGDRGLTSDSGWGCMIRSGQMLMAHALQRQHLSTSWRNPEVAPVGVRNQIAFWTLDAPRREHVFGFHSIAEVGAVYGKAAGEWYGPNAVAQVLRDLARRHHQEQDGLCRMVVFNDGALYRDQVAALCRKDGASPPAWESAAVVMVAMRLGLDRLNAEHIPALLAMFRLPWCLGCVGGSPRHSLYFVGARGRQVMYLDPHTTQAAVPPSVPVTSADDIPESYLASLTPPAPQYMPVDAVDPSLAVAFYCRDAADFDAMCEAVQAVFREAGGAPLFEVAATTPDYVTGVATDAWAEDGPVASWGDDAAPSPPPVAGAGGDAPLPPSDDDEFVLL